MPYHGRMLTRREALAALASAATLPLMSGCGRDGAAPPSAPPSTPPNGEAAALALLDSVADNLLRLYPETATSLGIDTGARAALRSQLADRSAEGQQRLAKQVRADLERVNAVDHDRPLACHAHQCRSRPKRLRDRARRLRAAVRRHHGRRLAQHALRRHSERRRVSRHPALPRQRSSDRERRRRRGVPGAPAVVREAARRRARTHPGRARRRARAAGVPDRQGAGADVASPSRTRAQGGSIVESIERRTKNIPGDWAERARDDRRARRSRPRSSGRSPSSRRSARSRRTMPGIWARPHGDEFYRWALKASTTTSHVAGRGPRDGPERAAAAARADGRDPEGDRLHARAPSASA